MFTAPTQGHYLGPGICCTCGHFVTSARELGPGDSRPSPGDFALCIRCCALNVFASKTGQLREPSVEEIIAASFDADVVRMRQAFEAGCLTPPKRPRNDVPN